MINFHKLGNSVKKKFHCVADIHNIAIAVSTVQLSMSKFLKTKIDKSIHSINNGSRKFECTWQ